MGPARSYHSFAAQTRRYFTRPHSAVPDAPLGGPAAWLGAQLRIRPKRWQSTLDAGDVDALERAMEQVRRAGLTLEEVTRARFPLPDLSARIAGWRAEIERGCGFMVVRGLPVAAWSADDAALAFWGIGHHLGLPGAQNPQQELLGHVTDYGEAGSDPFVRLYRTSANIDFHCDAADVVGLLCLQPARTGGQSRIVSTVTLFNQLLAERPDLTPRLFEPFKLDGRGEHRPGSPPFSLIAPCAYADGTLRTFYHSEYMRSVERLAGGALSDDERAVLDFYDRVAADPAVHLDMWLEAGDMQFLSNHCIAHARTAYTDDPERPRHLLRLWLSLDE
ncbi:MAG: TauD/TfdA family dioxygenase [Pseudomonadales bacterium]